jgi:hypothetical protein
MTVQSIIQRAGRMIQESTEGRRALKPWFSNEIGLNAFNEMLRELRGTHIGQRLARVWDAAAGDVALPGGIYAVNVYTPEQPFNGDRFQVLGACTVTASDDLIEGQSSITTTETTSWMYREDQGGWQKEEDLALADQSPLQAECDEALAKMLAARMYLENMGEVTPTLGVLAENGRNRIRQLYMNRTTVSVDNALLRGMAQRRSWPG